ncbi:MAG: hypothetical protein IJV75_04735, partial [Alphaproteobacteria bacterium]|nr:hypothetical protein [Alphaproteobacteria bacterium]
PELEEVGNKCFCNIHEISEINFPKLRIAGHNFLRAVGDSSNKRINLPNLEQVGNNFMCGGSGWGQYNCDYSVAEFNAPKLKTVGKDFMERCTDIGQMNMPSEINVQVETDEGEVKTFMPKMPPEKRPKPVALEPLFRLESPEEHQENNAKLSGQVSQPVIENNIQTPAVEPNTVSTQVVSNVVEAPRIPQATLSDEQRPMGLRNRLFALSEKGRIAKALSFAKQLFSKRNR